MKIYFHFAPSVFANTYLIGNENTKEALIIDPCKITEVLIGQIEKNNFNLSAVFITRNHRKSNENGLKTILKIYSPDVYAGNPLIDNVKTIALRGDGVTEAAGFQVKYFFIPGHAADSYMFQIENTVFIGASLSAGMMGKTSNIYAAKNLQSNLQKKLMSLSDDTIIMPAYGPPSTVGAERKFNSGLFKNFNQKIRDYAK
ncbi:hypothetical protein [Treponema pedis]|uniref:Metallo-beta-lactamase n=1 Tax=Treponema pedis str. T A4 TaxID=1291379 RepID=S6A4U0_9SPIR|nr:hypothetical protein [Treponema pedis]AGT44776.1 hypothetical protein TPE_2302 [Treponema pedis str. T A4]